jgi:hypothetical protein
MANRNKSVAAAMLAEVADEYIIKAEDEDKKDKDAKPEYPELWFMFDGLNTVVANFHEYPENEDEGIESGFVLQIRDTPYWSDIYDNTREFGQKTATETEHGSIIVAPIKPENKEDVLKAFNDIGFGAKKAKDQDHEELIREMDKLSTIKGGMLACWTCDNSKS